MTSRWVTLMVILVCQQALFWICDTITGTPVAQVMPQLEAVTVVWVSISIVLTLRDAARRRRFLAEQNRIHRRMRQARTPADLLGILG